MKAATDSAQTAVRSNKMQLTEARQVLNVEKGELMEIDMKKLKEVWVSLRVASVARCRLPLPLFLNAPAIFGE